MAWWRWRAGVFTNGTRGKRVTRNAGSGYFNVVKYNGKWRGQVMARGVDLRTSPHAEAWRAAVELEWVLGLWCAKHGEWRGCRCAACAPWLLAGVRGWCAGVPRSEVVTNLPQLQAEGRVGSDGRLAEAMEVDREPELPAPPAPKSVCAPALAAPKAMVRVAVGCETVAVDRLDVDVEVDESLYERDEATGMAREWLCDA